MTQFQQDLVKIGVDKGLLAIIAVIFGHFLSRGLERYKARTIFVQKLTDRKLDALAKFALIAEDLFFKILHVVELMEHATEEEAGEILDACDNFKKSFNQQKPELLQILVLYLPNMQDRFTDHAKLMSEFNSVLRHQRPLIQATPRLRIIADKMLKSVSNFQVAIREEMKKPPFWTTQRAAFSFPWRQ